MALGGGGNVLGLIFKIRADGTEKTKAEIRDLRAEFNKEVGSIKNTGNSAFLSLGQSAGFSSSQLATIATVAPIVVGALTTIASSAVAAGVAILKSFADV